MAVKGVAWRIHILKKALAYSQEFKAHSDRSCPGSGCERCRLLIDKFQKLPLSSFGFPDAMLSTLTDDHLLASILPRRGNMKFDTSIELRLSSL
eukprot:1604228-Amphidinium_carterae.1